MKCPKCHIDLETLRTALAFANAELTAIVRELSFTNGRIDIAEAERRVAVHKAAASLLSDMHQLHRQLPFPHKEPADGGR